MPIKTPKHDASNPNYKADVPHWLIAQNNNRRHFLKTSSGAATLLAAGGLGLNLNHQALAQTEENASEQAEAEASEQSQYTPGIEGRLAPELEVDYWIDANGKPASFTLAEHEGKWVFLKCFQNWCPGCHKSGFPTLKAFSDRFHDHPEVAIAGIQTVFEGYSSNTRGDVRALQVRYKLPIIMGHDPGNPDTHEVGSTMANYQTGGTPWLILINPAGVVVYNHFHVNTEELIKYVAEKVA